jgi:hypothetical protein
VGWVVDWGREEYIPEVVEGPDVAGKEAMGKECKDYIFGEDPAERELLSISRYCIFSLWIWSDW